MNDYTHGAWESLNYAVRLLRRLEKDEAVARLTAIKEILEAASATDLELKLKA